MIAQRSVWESRYYAIPRIHLILVGVIPCRMIHRGILFVLAFGFASSIGIPMILHLQNDRSTIDDFLESIPVILVAVAVPINLANIITKNKEIKTCLEMIEEDWLSLNTEDEKNILQQQTKYGQDVTTFYTVFLSMMLFFFYLKSFTLMALSESDISNTTDPIRVKLSRLPYRVDYGEKLNKYFYPIAVHCYIVGLYHIFITIAVDSLFYALIQHACGMFAVIGHTLENIGKDSSANFSLNPDKVKDDNYLIALNCLRRHLKILRFTGQIDSIYNHIFFISLYMAILIGSICGFQVSLNYQNGENVAAPLAIYFAQLFHLFFEFWQGQFLLDWSVVPYESICRSKWYYTSRRCRKIFLLIMNETMSPCKITAGNMITLSIENFGMVMKTSMSYFMMLRSFQ